MVAGPGAPLAVVEIVRDDVAVLAWPLYGARPLLVVIDRLARLRLAAQREGLSVRLRDPCAELADLIELVGMTALFPVLRSPHRCLTGCCCIKSPR